MNTNAAISQRVCDSLREAVHVTASQSHLSLKSLAGDLDWSPSDLSMRIALGGDSARAFPADDEHLLKMMRLTGIHAFLFTMADLLGYEPPQPKRERLGDLLNEVRAEFASTSKKVQMLLDLHGDKTVVPVPANEGKRTR